MELKAKELKEREKLKKEVLNKTSNSKEYKAIEKEIKKVAQEIFEQDDLLIKEWHQLDLDKKGYIIAEENTKTNVSGIFVAGDVQDRRYRQAITAAGLGCKAALDVIKFSFKEV